MERKNRVDDFVKDYKKAVHELSLPLIIGFGVAAVYNLTDTFFVGGLGPEAIAALTFAMPVFFLQFAISMGIGIGFTSVISMALGAKDKKRADNAAEHAMLLSIVLGVLLGIAGWHYCRELFTVMGATGRTLELAVEYFNIIFAALFILYGGVFARALLAGEGDTKTPTKVMIISSGINIILDPLLIYNFGWGVAGAAWATVIANLFTFIALGFFLLSKKGSYLDLNPRDFSFNPGIFRQALLIGVPAMVAQIIMSFGAAFINYMVAPFGAVAVAGFGIGTKIDSLVFLPFMAIGGALTTLAGMYYGARRMDLLRKSVGYGIGMLVAFSLVAGTLVYLFAESLLSAFTSDPEVIRIGVEYLRIIVFTYPLAAIAMSVGRMMAGIGRSAEGLVLISARVLIVFIPVALYFVYALGMGLQGIWYAIICASVVSATGALLFLRFLLPK